MQRLWKILRHDRRGAAAIEYGLIAGLVGAVLIVVLGAFGDRLTAVFEALADRMDQAQEQIQSPDTP
jgi:pilus assembly protein Flp/PilA